MHPVTIHEYYAQRLLLTERIVIFLRPEMLIINTDLREQ